MLLEVILNICILQRRVPNALEVFGAPHVPLYRYVVSSSVGVDTKKKLLLWLLGAHVFHVGAASYGFEGHQQKISTRALPTAGENGPELLSNSPQVVLL